MSPDEGLIKALREIRTRVDLHEQCPPSMSDFKDVMAICDEALGTHRASGEGGSPSALRASAPEGIDARLAACGWDRPVQHGATFTLWDDGNPHGFVYLVCPGGTMVPFGSCEGDIDEQRVRFIVDACNAVLGAKPAQSDGAAPSPTPEGISDQAAQLMARVNAAEDMVRHLRDAMSEAEVYIQRRGLNGDRKVQVLDTIDLAMTRCRLPIPTPRSVTVTDQSRCAAPSPTPEGIDAHRACPFCGDRREPEIQREVMVPDGAEGDVNNGPIYTAECQRCGAAGPVCSTPAEAMHEWDHGYTPQAQARPPSAAGAASAPEGNESDARRLMQAAIRYGQLVAIGRVLRDMDRDAASQGSFHERDEIDRTARASADAMSHCMTLMAKFQSVGANAPSLPEGTDALTSLRALHAEACALMDHSTGGSRSHAFFQRAAVTLAVLIEAMTQAQARTPSAAGGASAPEGCSR